MNLKDNKTVLYNLKNCYFMIKYSAFVPNLQGSFLNISLVEVGLDNLNSSKAVKLDQKESRIKIM